MAGAAAAASWEEERQQGQPGWAATGKWMASRQRGWTAAAAQEKQLRHRKHSNSSSSRRGERAAAGGGTAHARFQTLGTGSSCEALQVLGRALRNISPHISAPLRHGFLQPAVEGEGSVGGVGQETPVLRAAAALTQDAWPAKHAHAASVHATKQLRQALRPALAAGCTASSCSAHGVRKE